MRLREMTRGLRDRCPCNTDCPCVAIDREAAPSCLCCPRHVLGCVAPQPRAGERASRPIAPATLIAPVLLSIAKRPPSNSHQYFVRASLALSISYLSIIDLCISQWAYRLGIAFRNREHSSSRKFAYDWRCTARLAMQCAQRCVTVEKS